MSDDDGTFAINFGSGRRIDLDELRSRGEAIMPDGEHGWSISVAYGIDDPEKALDDMSLDESNFIGISSIHCLFCNVRYSTDNRHHKCSQRLPHTTV